MKIVSLTVKNWMNFQELENVPLHARNYVIGANAVGKSNFLDVFRFLRDVAAPAGAKPTAGGLQDAINRRGGLRALRCLHGKKDNEVLLDVTVADGQDRWRYMLGFKGEGRANNRVLIRQESVFKNDQPQPECQRPDDATSRTGTASHPRSWRIRTPIRRFVPSHTISAGPRICTWSRNC
jgi:predicted ATPase